MREREQSSPYGGAKSISEYLFVREDFGSCAERESNFGEKDKAEGQRKQGETGGKFEYSVVGKEVSHTTCMRLLLET